MARIPCFLTLPHRFGSGYWSGRSPLARRTRPYRVAGIAPACTLRNGPTRAHFVAAADDIRPGQRAHHSSPPSREATFPSLVKTPRKRSTRRRGRGPADTQLTSTSTSRTAYAETKRWLIEQHGAVCAYCGRRVSPSDITLDHVTPRRGQTAYDRRDNLVLACEDCNGVKADMPILAFLLRKRERAAVLLRYGTHLSPMLVKLVRDLVPEGMEMRRVKETFDDLGSDDESPYHESPYRD